jgi:hypothetical protein
VSRVNLALCEDVQDTNGNASLAEWQEQMADPGVRNTIANAIAAAIEGDTDPMTH